MQEGAGSSYRRDALGGDLYATVLAALRFQVCMHHGVVLHVLFSPGQVHRFSLCRLALSSCSISHGSRTLLVSYAVAAIAQVQFCVNIAGSVWYTHVHMKVLPLSCATHISVVALLQFPSQSLQEAGIHGHFFVNGGSLSLLSGTGRSVKQAVTDDFMQSWRWTAVCCFPCCSQLILHPHMLPMHILALAGCAVLVHPCICYASFVGD